MLTDDKAGEGEEKEEPKKPRPMVPIQHIGPIQFSEVAARYQIAICGVPDTAHSQMAGVIVQLEDALKETDKANARLRRSLELLTDPPPVAAA